MLLFKPVHWDRWSQRLELITGEVLPDQPVPLLRNRKELTREQAIALWGQKRQEGWRACGSHAPTSTAPADHHSRRLC